MESGYVPHGLNEKKNNLWKIKIIWRTEIIQKFTNDDPYDTLKGHK